MTTPNLENARRLAELLLNEQAGIDFRMTTGLAYRPAGQHHGSIDQICASMPVPEPCGSTACIAGAAFVLWMQDATPEQRAEVLDRVPPDFNGWAGLSRVFYPWSLIEEAALAFLGLKRQSDSHIGHDLFDATLAPYECTRRQAVEALERVMAGQKPWPQQA